MKTTDYTYDYTGLLLAFSTSDPSYKRSGLWRAFTPTLIVREALNGNDGSSSVGKTTVTCYQTDSYNLEQLGNPTHRLEYNQWLTIDPATQLTNCGMPTTGVAPVRITRWRYTATDDSSFYIADRIAQIATFAANENTLLAVTERF